MPKAKQAEKDACALHGILEATMHSTWNVARLATRAGYTTSRVTQALYWLEERNLATRYGISWRDTRWCHPTAPAPPTSEQWEQISVLFALLARETWDRRAVGVAQIRAETKIRCPDRALGALVDDGLISFVPPSAGDAHKGMYRIAGGERLTRHYDQQPTQPVTAQPVGYRNRIIAAIASIGRPAKWHEITRIANVGHGDRPKDDLSALLANGTVVADLTRRAAEYRLAHMKPSSYAIAVGFDSVDDWIVDCVGQLRHVTATALARHTGLNRQGLRQTLEMLVSQSRLQKDAGRGNGVWFYRLCQVPPRRTDVDRTRDEVVAFLTDHPPATRTEIQVHVHGNWETTIEPAITSLVEERRVFKASIRLANTALAVRYALTPIVDGSAIPAPAKKTPGRTLFTADAFVANLAKLGRPSTWNQVYSASHRGNAPPPEHIISALRQEGRVIVDIARRSPEYRLPDMAPSERALVPGYDSVTSFLLERIRVLGPVNVASLNRDNSRLGRHRITDACRQLVAEKRVETDLGTSPDELYYRLPKTPPHPTPLERVRGEVASFVARAEYPTKTEIQRNVRGGDLRLINQAMNDLLAQRKLYRASIRPRSTRGASRARYSATPIPVNALVPEYLYVAGTYVIDTRSFIKFGMSVNPDRRILSYKQTGPQTCIRWRARVPARGPTANEYEKLVKSEFTASRRPKTELYLLEAEDAIVAFVDDLITKWSS